MAQVLKVAPKPVEEILDKELTAYLKTTMKDPTKLSEMLGKVKELTQDHVRAVKLLEIEAKKCKGSPSDEAKVLKSAAHLDKIYTKKVSKIIDEYTGEGERTAGWVLGGMMYAGGVISILAPDPTLASKLGGIIFLGTASGIISGVLMDKKTEEDVTNYLKVKGVIK